MDVAMLLAVLSNGGHGGAMVVWHGEFLIKRHQITVALQVSNGGHHRFNGGGRMEVMAEEIFFF